MTSFELQAIPFRRHAVREWGKRDPRHRNWPVVYVIGSRTGTKRSGSLLEVYVGETLNAESRILQHLDSPSKANLSSVHVVLDETYNKSACLDLESHLIRLLAGDGSYRVLNGNAGVIDADYYNRAVYQETFRDVFELLRAKGVFTRSIPEIENSDLFKLSPFKTLTIDQAVAVEDIVEGLLGDLQSKTGGMTVIQGEPGTGKTVVASYLIKLLADIAQSRPDDEKEPDSIFSEFFAPGYRELLEGFRVGLVVPQQSLRATIQQVFSRTPGLSSEQVLTPYQVGESDTSWDLLIVDEAHRLNLRANQPSGALNRKFIDINEHLFGFDDPEKTQLDWIRARSTSQILLIDPLQRVRPADLALETLQSLVSRAKAESRFYPLATQMRVKAGEDYIGYVRAILKSESMFSDVEVAPQEFGEYDLRFYEDLGEMHSAIRARDDQHGLARLVAGYAWEWKSRNNRLAFDIELDGIRLRWNQADRDWINSAGAINEVGSIHTVQGYDLNYAGVIIGRDLRYDPVGRRLRLSREDYFDTKGKENNKRLGKEYSDDDILRFVVNIYAVLLTRGIRGTYVYVCDPPLRERLRPYFSIARSE